MYLTAACHASVTVLTYPPRGKEGESGIYPFFVVVCAGGGGGGVFTFFCSAPRGYLETHQLRAGILIIWEILNMI